MDTSKLVPGDTRVKQHSAQIRGKTYTYIVGEPQGSPIDTIFLIHGWPDLGFGWRYQVPVLMAAGFRVVVPDMVGYGGTDAPQELEAYTFKSASADINELAIKIVGEGQQIILGGHDWGGAVVWRVVEWHPKLVKAVFSVCTPYFKPNKTYIDLEQVIAAGKLRNFSYQLKLRGPEPEAKIQGEEKVRQFLNAMFGGRGPNGEFGFSVEDGPVYDNLPKLQHTRLLSEAELNHYVEMYMKQPAPQLRGPLNWYRTRKLNYEDDLPLVERQGNGPTFHLPSLFILATGDTALPPAMAAGMDKEFTNLTRVEVDSSHWALVQAAADTNKHILKWLEGVMGGKMKSSL